MRPVPSLLTNQQGMFSPFFTCQLKSFCQCLWRQTQQWRGVYYAKRNALSPYRHYVFLFKLYVAWGRCTWSLWVCVPSHTWWHLSSPGPHLDAGLPPQTQPHGRTDLKENYILHIFWLYSKVGISKHKIATQSIYHDMKLSCSSLPSRPWTKADKWWLSMV